MPAPPRLAKYFGKLQEGPDHQKLFWPGTADGFPFVGAPPVNLKQEEYEDIPHAFFFDSKIFKLPADIEEYNRIMDQIANGLCLKFREEFLPSKEEEGIFYIFLSWAFIGGVSTPPSYQQQQFR